MASPAPPIALLSDKVESDADTVPSSEKWRNRRQTRSRWRAQRPTTDAATTTGADTVTIGSAEDVRRIAAMTERAAAAIVIVAVPTVSTIPPAPGGPALRQPVRQDHVLQC